MGDSEWLILRKLSLKDRFLSVFSLEAISYWGKEGRDVHLTGPRLSCSAPSRFPLELWGQWGQPPLPLVVHQTGSTHSIIAT